MAELSEVEGAVPQVPGEFVSFPDSPFQLFQPYPPAGDQPEAIGKLVEGVQDGLAFQTLLGVTGSGKTFTMANVIARLGRPASRTRSTSHYRRSRPMPRPASGCCGKPSPTSPRWSARSSTSMRRHCAPAR